MDQDSNEIGKNIQNKPVTSQLIKSGAQSARRPSKFRGISNFIDRKTFKLKKRFFSSDLSVILYTLSLYTIGILIYAIFVFSPWMLFPFPPWDFFTIFLPFWTTICGFLLTVLVLLKINIQKTETGKEFLDILLHELTRTSSGEQFSIITPNINMGQFAYPDGFEITKKSLFGASKRGVKIRFITLGIREGVFEELSP